MTRWWGSEAAGHTASVDWWGQIRAWVSGRQVNGNWKRTLKQSDDFLIWPKQQLAILYWEKSSRSPLLGLKLPDLGFLSRTHFLEMDKSLTMYQAAFVSTSHYFCFIAVVTQVLFTHLCPTLCSPMDCSWTGFCTWNSLGENTGEGGHVLLQGIFLTKGSNRGLPCCRQILHKPNASPNSAT